MLVILLFAMTFIIINSLQTIAICILRYARVLYFNNSHILCSPRAKTNWVSRCFIVLKASPKADPTHTNKKEAINDSKLSLWCQWTRPPLCITHLRAKIPRARLWGLQTRTEGPEQRLSGFPPQNPSSQHANEPSMVSGREGINRWNWACSKEWENGC